MYVSDPSDSWLKNGGLRTDLLDGASLVKLAGSSTLLYEKTTAISAWAAPLAGATLLTHCQRPYK